MDELVVVGGLVPSLLIDQEKLPENVTAHVGTLDLDLGLAFALVGEQRYQDVVERLRNAKFTADVNEEGKPTRQRWCISDPPVTVDFLIEPEQGAEAQAGRLFPLTKDWAAIIAPGLHLAFRNNQVVTLDGRTIVGETAKRTFACAEQGRLLFSRRSLSTFAGEQGRLRPILPASQLRVRRLGRGHAPPSASPGRQRDEGTGTLTG